MIVLGHWGQCTDIFGADVSVWMGIRGHSDSLGSGHRDQCVDIFGADVSIWMGIREQSDSLGTLN